MTFIENIARAIAIKGKKVLLARQIGAFNTFLPGGHIEYGETADEALDREMLEELGLKGTAGDFLFTIENIFFAAKGNKNHEFAVYFRYMFAGSLKERDFVSKEPHLEFLWADLKDLKKLNLKPDILPDLINKINSKKSVKSFYSVADTSPCPK